MGVWVWGRRRCVDRGAQDARRARKASHLLVYHGRGRRGRVGRVLDGCRRRAQRPGSEFAAGNNMRLAIDSLRLERYYRVRVPRHRSIWECFRYTEMWSGRLKLSLKAGRPFPFYGARRHARCTTYTPRTRGKHKEQKRQAWTRRDAQDRRRVAEVMTVRA